MVFGSLASIATLRICQGWAISLPENYNVDILSDFE